MAALTQEGCGPHGFYPGTVLPEQRAVLATTDHGQAGRELMAAVFRGDQAYVDRTLGADPALGATASQDDSLLSVAIARQDKAMVALLLRHRAALDRPRVDPPLVLALRANDPAYAIALLDAGASAKELEPNSGSDPMREAVMMGSLGAVQLLVRHGADFQHADSVGRSPLTEAVTVGEFSIAAYLIEQGADVWTINAGGLSAAAIVPGPVAVGGAREQAAKERVIALLKSRGWPWPPPSPDEIVRLALAGRWPPPAALKAGAEPVRPEVMAVMRERFNPDGSPRNPPRP